MHAPSDEALPPSSTRAGHVFFLEFCRPEKDRHNKTSAKTAWKKFVGQNPAVHNASFTVDPADVYALVSI